jgi:hypothetical protein
MQTGQVTHSSDYSDSVTRSWVFHLDKIDPDLAIKLHAYWKVQRDILAVATAPPPAEPSQYSLYSQGASQTL